MPFASVITVDFSNATPGAATVTGVTGETHTIVAKAAVATAASTLKYCPAYTGVRKTQGAAMSYTTPSAIPVGFMSHGATYSKPFFATWIGFARGHYPSSTGYKLVGSIGAASFAIQADCHSYWSDGSVRAARLCMTLPRSLTSGTEVTGTVTPTAGAPVTTALATPAAIVAAKDITLKTYGYDCGSRIFITSLREIVTNFPRDTWGSNPLGGWDVPISGPQEVMIRGWRFRKDSSSGAYDAWVKDTIYLSYRASGDYEVICRSEQSNWDGPVSGATVFSGTQTKRACIAELYDGATRIGAWGGPNDARVGTIAASAFATTGNTMAWPAGFNTNGGQGIVFAPASGGVLPSGITPGTPYWLQSVNYGSAAALCVGRGTDRIALGKAGSGNITTTPVVATNPGSSCLFAGTDGLPIRIGASRIRTTIKWDEAYLSKGARLFPTYDQAMKRLASPTVTETYFPNMQPYGNWLSTTGDDPGDERIGYIPGTHCQWLLLPHDDNYARRSVVMAMGWADYQFWYCNPTSGRLMVSDNGPDNVGASYTNLGPSRPNASFNNGRGQNDGWLGNGAAVDASGYHDGYSSSPIDGSHMPVPWVVPCLMTGHPIFADIGRMQANTCQLYSPTATRQHTVGGTPFYSFIPGSQQLRGAGWLLRAFGFAEAFTPAASPEAPYIKHLIDQNADYLGAVIDTNPTGMGWGYLPPYQADVGGTMAFYFASIWMLAVAMEAWRGDRPNFRKYVEAEGNLSLGIANDANTAGGTGYIMSGGYGQRFYDPATGQIWADLRALIAGNTEWFNLNPPYPAAGVQPGSVFLKSNPFPYCATDYLILWRAHVAICANMGIVSMNADNARSIYNAVMTRISTPPCNGVIFSQGTRWAPAWAIVIG